MSAVQHKYDIVTTLKIKDSLDFLVESAQSRLLFCFKILNFRKQIDMLELYGFTAIENHPWFNAKRAGSWSHHTIFIITISYHTMIIQYFSYFHSWNIIKIRFRYSVYCILNTFIGENILHYDALFGKSRSRGFFEEEFIAAKSLSIIFLKLYRNGVIQ